VSNGVSFDWLANEEDNDVRTAGITRSRIQALLFVLWIREILQNPISNLGEARRVGSLCSCVTTCEINLLQIGQNSVWFATSPNSCKTYQVKVFS
jgi:hypothetical protein